MEPFHVAVAAEAFAAGMFAQAGCDVSVQYGANQPEYDLIVSKGDRFLKISVKGSQDGGWGLCQNYKEGATYHQAIDRWAADQSPRIVYCFVQFQRVTLGTAPRAFLATVQEVAEQMKRARNGLGQTILYEDYCYKKGAAKGFTDCLPRNWRLSEERIAVLLQVAA